MNTYMVKFQNSKGDVRVIADMVTDRDAAMSVIKDFCAERDYKIPYIRSWGSDEKTTYDVGSHTEFFYVEKFDEGIGELP